MNLYVLRHASAGVRRVNPKLDVKRPLDKEGKQQCILIANALNAMRIHFDCVASSPLKRALQTASMVSTEIGYEAKILVTEALAPEATIPTFQQFLSEMAVHENVLVVGHNPNLQHFLSSLVSQGRANIRLRKGSLARVELTRRPGTLNWLVDPRLLRQVYTSVTRRSRRKTSRK
jgi:phosphohistidine phosphatase